VPPSVLIVSPYAARANNGNWRTAERWSQLLRPDHDVIVRTVGDSLPQADRLIALHARRAHAAVRAWHDRTPRRPCLLVLTGTDLYRDIPDGVPEALESLRLADRLIVLQERAIASLPARYRRKAVVVYQSAVALPVFRKSSRVLRALFVGHLRAEKDPLTFVDAAAMMASRPDIAFAMVGGARDADLAKRVGRAAARLPNISLPGALSHARTRERIRRAHVLVVPSRMEGGANVVVEAVTAGTPVIASECDGNVGMLGANYPGYFRVGDSAALAALLVRCRDEPRLLERLVGLCAARARAFRPQAERRALKAALTVSRT
jgi:putative glycosyltransferase (TIGR04348 family)